MTKIIARIGVRKMDDDRLGRIVDLASRFIKKYRCSSSLEGVVLFGSQIVGAIDEQSDIDLLFVLSDSILPRLIEKVKEMHGDRPTVGIWTEWELLGDETLPITQYYKFEEMKIDCLFATLQMIRNSIQTYRPSTFHSIFQEGIILYDKNGMIVQLSKETIQSLGIFLENLKDKVYEEFEILLKDLKRFLEQDDLSTVEIISVHCAEDCLKLMFALEKRVPPQTQKRIMLDSRKYLPSDIVNQVERVLLTQDFSERLALLKDLHQTIVNRMKENG